MSEENEGNLMPESFYHTDLLQVEEFLEPIVRRFPELTALLNIQPQTYKEETEKRSLITEYIAGYEAEKFMKNYLTPKGPKYDSIVLNPETTFSIFHPWIKRNNVTYAAKETLYERRSLTIPDGVGFLISISPYANEPAYARLITIIEAKCCSTEESLFRARDSLQVQYASAKHLSRILSLKNDDIRRGLGIPQLYANLSNAIIAELAIKNQLAIIEIPTVIQFHRYIATRSSLNNELPRTMRTRRQTSLPPNIIIAHDRKEISL